MKIDSHQHFWRYAPGEYPWMSAEMDALRRDFLPRDLQRELAKIDFDGSIAVQARQKLSETAWLLELSDRHSFIKGVVGWVDLSSLEAAEQLEKFASHPKLLGVRHVLHDEPDDQFMLRPDFRRGIGLLERFDLTYDLLLLPRHLRHAVRLVGEFEKQPFVLDHIGKPLIRNGSLSPWREDLRRLAEFPNVFCKVSGMVTEAEWSNWKPKDFRPYLDTVFECFGEDRVMIGSDWPVCLLSGGYAEVTAIVLDYLDWTSAAAVLGENCARFYQVPEAEPN